MDDDADALDANDLDAQLTGWRLRKIGEILVRRDGAMRARARVCLSARQLLAVFADVLWNRVYCLLSRRLSYLFRIANTAVSCWTTENSSYLRQFDWSRLDFFAQYIFVRKLNKCF